MINQRLSVLWLCNSLKLGSIKPPSSFPFSRLIWLFGNFFWFLENLGLFFSISVKNSILIFISHCIESVGGLGSIVVQLLSHVQLSDPMDCSPPGSSVHEIFQARVLEWGAIAFSGRLPCPSPIPGAYSNLCPSSRWCRPTISSSVIPFSFPLQFLPASQFFPRSQFFA